MLCIEIDLKGLRSVNCGKLLSPISSQKFREINAFPTSTLYGVFTNKVSTKWVNLLLFIMWELRNFTAMSPIFCKKFVKTTNKTYCRVDVDWFGGIFSKYQESLDFSTIQIFPTLYCACKNTFFQKFLSIWIEKSFWTPTCLSFSFPTLCKYFI